MHTALEIEDVQWANRAPQFANAKGRSSAAQKAGKRYEKKALQFLFEQSSTFIPLPWLRYKLKNEKGYRWCQPDGVHIDFVRGYVKVIECKIRHTSSAFKKLRDLYIPLLQYLFPATLWTIIGIEFTRAFDCAVRVPVTVKLYPSVDVVAPGIYGVVVWDQK